MKRTNDNRSKLNVRNGKKGERTFNDMNERKDINFINDIDVETMG